MNRRLVVLFSAFAAIVVFAGAALLYERTPGDAAPAIAAGENNELVRPHSPVIGPAQARVTVVEFFDPSCEACRAFFPEVKKILAQYPTDVRLVMRYVPFHPASEEAIRILEASRKQGKFDAVLAALMERQDEWGADGAPDPDKAWQIAGETGLDLVRARTDAKAPEVDAVAKQDMADLQAVKVQGTPTFFINGKPLSSFGLKQLQDQVKAEVDAARGSS